MIFSISFLTGSLSKREDFQHLVLDRESVKAGEAVGFLLDELGIHEILQCMREMGLCMQKLACLLHIDGLTTHDGAQNRDVLDVGGDDFERIFVENDRGEGALHVFFEVQEGRVAGDCL